MACSPLNCRLEDRTFVLARDLDALDIEAGGAVVNLLYLDVELVAPIDVPGQEGIFLVTIC